MTPAEQYNAAPSEFSDPGNASYPYPQPALDALCDALATLRADNDARGVLIEDLRHAVNIANARADRQAARAELAEAETARQQRIVALFVRVLREMTPGDV
jgi:hypothetical protein